MKNFLIILISLLVVLTIVNLSSAQNIISDNLGTSTYLDKSNKGGQGERNYRVCATTIGWNDTKCWNNVTIEGYSEKHLFLVIKWNGMLRFISTNMNIILWEKR